MREHLRVQHQELYPNAILHENDGGPTPFAGTKVHLMQLFTNSDKKSTFIHGVSRYLERERLYSRHVTGFASPTASLTAFKEWLQEGELKHARRPVQTLHGRSRYPPVHLFPAWSTRAPRNDCLSMVGALTNKPQGGASAHFLRLRVLDNSRGAVPPPLRERSH